MAQVDPDSISSVRAFNRFWTTRIGVLDATLLDTPFSLTQARVLYELHQADCLPVSTLLAALRVDPGYLSRLLKGLVARGLLTVAPDPADRRRRLAALTPDGRAAAADLDRRSVDQLRAILADLSPDAVASALHAMTSIQAAFRIRVPVDPSPAPVDVMSSEAETSPPFNPSPIVPQASPPASSLPPRPSATLRDLRPGDLGWVVARHGALYAAEYSWDMSFEALVARIVADFAAGHDPDRERAWIADLDGVPAGCIFCVRAESADGKSGDSGPGVADTAQLRLLLVEPSARGHGVASALVRACLHFARAAGYTRIVLWTNDVLTAARRTYERESFTLISEEPHTSFGRSLVGQYWGKDL